MTNDKAIERIKAFRDYLCGGNPIWDVDECKEAFDIALAAMSERNLDEWCDNCKEYDHSKHCCPRFNRVIRETVEEVKQNAEPRWIPVSERLPENTRTVLTTFIEDGVAKVDTLYYFREPLGWTDFRYDEGLGRPKSYEVTAWMPLPEPWRGESDA